ncbi:Dynamin-3 [Manis pentadactyla]|nr:Dynamin-3 [Manis pentadactyla]
MSPSLAKALHRRPEPSNSGCLPPAPGPHLARVPVPFSRRPGLAAAAHRKATGLHRRFSPPKRSHRPGARPSPALPAGLAALQQPQFIVSTGNNFEVNS